MLNNADLTTFGESCVIATVWGTINDHNTVWSSISNGIFFKFYKCSFDKFVWILKRLTHTVEKSMETI